MKNILRNLRITRVASVDKGAGEGVDILITKNDGDPTLTDEYFVKRDFSDKKRRDLARSGHALPDGSFPIENEEDLHNAVRLAGHAKEPAKAKRHIIARAKAMGMTSALPDDWKVSKGWADYTSSVLHHASQMLKASVQSITQCDEALLNKTFTEYDEYVQSTVAASGTDDPTRSTVTDGNNGGVNKKESDMTKEEMDAAIKKAADESKAAVEAVNKALEEAKDQIAFLSMAPKYQEFAKAMSPADKKKFAAKKDDDKDQDMADCAKRAREQVPESVRKVLEEAEAVKKANEDLKKRLETLEGDKETETLTKRATEIGLGKDGVDVLRKARKGDVVAIAKLEDTIKALHTQVREAGLFGEFGVAGQGKAGSAYDQIAAKAAELRKADAKLTQEQAFSKAYEDPANKDLVALYKRESRSVAA